MGSYDSQEMCNHLASGGEFLVLTFTKSKNQLREISSGTPVRVKSREHWFFKVEASKRITYRPYNAGLAIAGFKQQLEGVQDPYLDPEEGIGAVQLIDQNGNDILRNDDDDWFVYHISTSPLQGDIRVYPQIPDSQPGGVFQYLGSNRPNASIGDPIGYISGDDHPSYYDPETGLSSTLIWNTGVNTDVRYQFYNEHKTRRKTPLLNIAGAGYVLNPVVDDNVQRNLLHAANTGDDSVTHIDWGPIRETYSYEVPDEWDSAGNYIEETEPNIPSKYRRPSFSRSSDQYSSEGALNETIENIRQADEYSGDLKGMTDSEIAEVVRRVVDNG